MSTNMQKAIRRKCQGELVAVFAAFVLLSGCATTSNVRQIEQLDSIGDDPRIVLMPPDIRYYLVTASGVPEANAEWTESAKANFSKALLDYSDTIGADLKTIAADNMSPEEFQYETLHSAVGLTLMQHYFGYAPLPGKAGNFDWSLGPGVRIIGANHEADYALFVYYRDYQASGGRVAFAMLAAVAGVGVSTGATEHGFASLVDLKTGDIVWFNVVRAGKGELRNADDAARAVDDLFKDIPTANGAPEAG
jgi:hypothetical protein